MRRHHLQRERLGLIRRRRSRYKRLRLRSGSPAASLRAV